MVNLESIEFKTISDDYVNIDGKRYEGSASIRITVPVSTIVYFHAEDHPDGSPDSSSDGSCGGSFGGSSDGSSNSYSYGSCGGSSDFSGFVLKWTCLKGNSHYFSVGISTFLF